MIHVVDFEKTPLFDPFSGHFVPMRPTIRR